MGKEIEQGPPPCPPPSYAQAVNGGPQLDASGRHLQPTIVTTVVPISNQSTRMICPHCHAQISSVTKPTPGLIAYISGLVICLLGGILGCCLIPCCIDECMDVHHNCPKCDAYLGVVRR